MDKNTTIQSLEQLLDFDNILIIEAGCGTKRTKNTQPTKSLTETELTMQDIAV